MKSFFTPKEVRELIGLNYRRLQYWDKSYFVRPSYRRRGKYRLYTFRDLLLLFVAMQCLAEGMSRLNRVRPLLKYLGNLLSEFSMPLIDVCVVIDPDTGGVGLTRGEFMRGSLPKLLLVQAAELRSKIEESWGDR